PVLPDRHRPAAALAQPADQPGGAARADPPAHRPVGDDLLERQPHADVGAAQHDGVRGPARRQQPADAGDRRQRTGRVRHAGQGPGDRQERADAEDRFRQEVTAPPGPAHLQRAGPGLPLNAALPGGVFLCTAQNLLAGRGSVHTAGGSQGGISMRMLLKPLLLLLSIAVASDAVQAADSAQATRQDSATYEEVAALLARDANLRNEIDNATAMIRSETDLKN